MVVTRQLQFRCDTPRIEGQGQSYAINKVTNARPLWQSHHCELDGNSTGLVMLHRAEPWTSLSALFGMLERA